jgi:hypothetical protein
VRRVAFTTKRITLTNAFVKLANEFAKLTVRERASKNDATRAALGPGRARVLRLAIAPAARSLRSGRTERAYVPLSHDDM